MEVDDHGGEDKASVSTGAGVAIHTAGHPEAGNEEDKFSGEASRPSNGDSSQDSSALEGKQPPHPHLQAQAGDTTPNLLPLQDQATTPEDHDHEGGSESRMEMDVDDYANGGERGGKNVNANVVRIKKVQDGGDSADGALEVEVEDEPMLGADGGGGAAAGAWNHADDSKFSGRTEEVEGLGGIDLNHHVDSDENEAVDLNARRGRADDGACVGDQTNSRTNNERVEPPAEGVDECTVCNGIDDGDRTMGRHDKAPELELEYEVGTESHGVKHTKGLAGGGGADDDSAFEAKQPDGHAPNLLPLQPTTGDANDGDEGGGSVNVDVVRLKKVLDESGCGGGSRGADGLEVGVEVEVERDGGGGGAAGVKDHADEFSGREGINQNRNIDEDEAGDPDAYNGFVDDGASSEGQADYTNDDEIAAEPPAEGDDENTVDNGGGSTDDDLVGDVTAPDIDQDDSDEGDGDSCSKDHEAEDPNVIQNPAESSSTQNSDDEIHRLRQALENEQKTSARLRAELKGASFNLPDSSCPHSTRKAQSKNRITFLASLSLPTSIVRREQHHLQVDQHANTQSLQDALHALQDEVDREVEVCMCGGGEYAIGAVELEKNQNGKRRRRLSEEEEDGVDDFGEPRGSEQFSVEDPPRSRFKRARIE
ncbi:hypothetical protein GALMADRAFT_232191 [Galerina marginata CBS 339.88]|uniref:Uncharacterized protein n=1 Tax=Galerina marginata (strain CBS 339.88) TaxID=685588 RepID=A0A067SHH1_GALM3|nr:hypothetical protein GALMADRAFT_232191 [Galerina marginata CBS 339.88]